MSETCARNRISIPVEYEASMSGMKAEPQPTLIPCEDLFQYRRYGECHEKQISIVFGGKYDDWVGGEAYSQT